MTEENFVPEDMQALHLPPLDYDPKKPPGARPLMYETGYPAPVPSPTQYLLKVQTASFTRDELNRPETLRRRAAIPAHAMCGQVICTPNEDQWNQDGPKFKIDDDVFGLLSWDRDGAAADYTLATENELAFKPKNITAAEAASIPLGALTAWQAFFRHGGLDPYETSGLSGRAETDGAFGGSGGGHGRSSNSPLRVLVTNAWESDVGVHAIRLLRSRTLFSNTRVWICGTCSLPGHAANIHTELGADAVIDYASYPDATEAFLENGWGPVDIVLDCIGGDTLRQVHSPAVVKGGGVVLSVCQSVPDGDEVGKEWEAAKAEIRNRKLTSKFFDVEPEGKALAWIGQLVEKGEVRGNIDFVEDLLRGREAMLRMEEKRSSGRIVLRAN